MNNIRPLVPLAEILKPITRPEWVDPEKIYRILGAHWYAEGLYVKDTLPGSQIRADKVFRVEKEDFVYNRLFAWKGSFAIATEANAGCYVSNEFPCFEINQDRADAQFLWRYFSRVSAWEKALVLSTGGTPTSRNRLKEDKFLAIKIPLPSLSEQRRIVAQIEELAAKINEARGIRHQSMLAGKALTSAYLNRLFGDYYKGLAGQLKRPNWTCLNNVVTDVADGPHITPTYVAAGIPFITVLNITSGRIQFRDHKYVSADDHAQFQKRAKAEIGDVLISKDGTIGIPCVVDTDRPFSFFVSVALIKPKRSELDGRFLAWVIRTPYLQERIKSRSRGDMIRHLVLREIRELMIPLPSIPEQRVIVAELDDMQARADELKKLQGETATELDALLPSILDKAFN